MGEDLALGWFDIKY